MFASARIRLYQLTQASVSSLSSMTFTCSVISKLRCLSSSAPGPFAEAISMSLLVTSRKLENLALSWRKIVITLPLQARKIGLLSNVPHSTAKRSR